MKIVRFVVVNTARKTNLQTYLKPMFEQPIVGPDGKNMKVKPLCACLLFLEFKGEVNANLTHIHSLPRSSRVSFSSLSVARSLCPFESFSPIALPLSLSSVRALARAVSGCVDFGSRSVACTHRKVSSSQSSPVSPHRHDDTKTNTAFRLIKTERLSRVYRASSVEDLIRKALKGLRAGRYRILQHRYTGGAV